jgi:Cutinase
MLLLSAAVATGVIAAGVAVVSTAGASPSRHNAAAMSGARAGADQGDNAKDPADAAARKAALEVKVKAAREARTKKLADARAKLKARLEAAAKARQEAGGKAAGGKAGGKAGAGLGGGLGAGLGAGLGGGLGAGLGGAKAPQATPQACTAFAFLNARGTGERQGPEGVVLQPTFNAVAKVKAGGAVHDVVYPATADFVNGPRQGAADILSFLAAQSKACPAEKFVLTGYSQGAMAVAVATQQMDAATRGKIAAIAVFGDPFFQPNQPWDAATNAASPGGIARAQNGLRAFPLFGNVIQDFCNANDSVCGSGSGIQGHLTYGNRAQAAANFIASKL